MGHNNNRAASREIHSLPGLRSGLRERLCRLLSALLLLVLPAVTAAHSLEADIAHATQQIEAAPDDAVRYARRAGIYHEYADFDAAISDYNHALKLDPRLADAHAGLGRSLLELGRTDAALQALDRALHSDPLHTEALRARARAHRTAGNHLAEAADYLRLIHSPVTGKSPLPDHYIGAAHALADAGPVHLPRAVILLDEGMQHLGDLPALQYTAIELERRQGRHDAALQRVDALLQQATRRDGWLLLRAEILIEAGRDDAARQDLHAALQAIETLPPARRLAPATRMLVDSIHERLASIDGGR